MENLKQLKTSLLKERERFSVLLDWFDNYRFQNIVFKDLSIKKIIKPKFFSPRANIELIFNSNMISSISRSARVYQCNEKNSLILISQTSPPTFPDFKYKKLEVSTLIKKIDGKVIRIAFNSKIIRFISNYKLQDKIIKKGLLLEYSTPMREINLRTSYRYELNETNSVKGVISYKGKTYYSGRDFKVIDISVTGIGINTIYNESEENSLSDIKTGDHVKIEITMISFNQIVSKVSTFVEITRKISLKDNVFFIGIKFFSINNKYEQVITKFINEAQSYDIRASLDVTGDQKKKGTNYKVKI